MRQIYIIKNNNEYIYQKYKNIKYKNETNIYN